MFVLYDLIFAIFVLGYLPIFIFKRKFHNGFMMRLGFFPNELKKTLVDLHPLWVHAVSVGEALASRKLIEGLRKSYPKKKIVISTVTPTGNKIIRGIVSSDDIIIYLPLDFSFIVRRVVKMVNPSLFIIAETEIWPNLISCIHGCGVPIVTVNARISDASFIGYSAVKPLIKAILNKVDLFCVQTLSDSRRLTALGVVRDKISITGNMKFDNVDYINYVNEDAKKSLAHLKPQHRLLVAGSTHPPEEEMLLLSYLRLFKDFPDLRLLIAPRHPERARSISKLVLAKACGFQPILVSSLNASFPNSNLVPVFILDIMGGLNDIYKLADIVFVGGSLVRKGGHNILEPAYFAKPIIFGPHMFNFKDMAGLFISHQAAIQVKNKDELIKKVRLLLNSPAQVAVFGSRGRDLLLKNKGATEHNLAKIKELFI